MADEQKQSLDVDAALREQFAQLPEVVQSAITSADTQKHLRELSDKRQLHIDQWQLLENEVMLSLMGLQPVEDLARNIEREVGVQADTAAELAADISKTIFEPVRAELERELGKPEAPQAAQTPVDMVREEILDRAKAAPVAPATPPPPQNEAKVARAPVSESYKAGESSAGRKSIHDDPYREPPA